MIPRSRTHPSRHSLAPALCLLVALALSTQPLAAQPAPDPPPEATETPTEPEPTPEPTPEPIPDPEPETDTEPQTPGTPEETLQAAQLAYLDDDYETALRLLLPLANPQEAAALSVPLRVDIYQMLGLCSLALEPPRTEDAQAWFRALLTIQPDFVFVEGLVPQDAIDTLAVVREDMGLDGDNGGNGGNGGMTTIYIQKEVQQQIFWVNFLPLGFGQFQNGDDGLGATLAIFQSIALGANIVSYLVLEDLREPNGLYSEGNFPLAQNLQTTQFATLAAFLGLWAAGAIHAWINYEGTTIDIRTLPGPPPELTQAPDDPILGSGHARFLEASIAAAQETPEAFIPALLPPTTASGRAGVPTPIVVFQIEGQF